MKRLLIPILLCLFVVAAPAQVDITKANTEIVGWTNLASGGGVGPGEYVWDADDHISATFTISVAAEATNTNRSQILILEARDADNGSCATAAELCKWTIVRDILTSSSAVTSSALDASEPAGETTIAEVTTAGFSEDAELVFIKDNTIANSEIVRIHDVNTSTSFEIFTGLQFAHDTSDTWYEGAVEQFVHKVDLSSVERVQILINNNHSGGTAAINYRIDVVYGSDIQ